MKKNKGLLFIIITSILSFLGFQTVSKDIPPPVQAKDNNVDTEHLRPACYEIAAPTTPRKQSKDELQKRLKMLEQQYKDKLIDEPTYNKIKQDLLKDLKNAE